MESNQSLSTPSRRSTRLQNARDSTPEVQVDEKKVRGPRSMAKLKKSQLLIDKAAAKISSPPTITITRPSLVPAIPKQVIESDTVSDAAEPTVEASKTVVESSEDSSKPKRGRKRANRGKKNHSPESVVASQSSETITNEISSKVDDETIESVIKTIKSPQQVEAEEKEVEASPEDKLAAEEKLVEAEKEVEASSEGKLAVEVTAEENIFTEKSPKVKVTLEKIGAEALPESEVQVETVFVAKTVEAPEVPEIKAELPSPEPEDASVETAVSPQSEDTMPVKTDDSLSAKEQSTWTAQEPHAVSEASSGAVNEEFHSMDSTAGDFNATSLHVNESIISVADSPTLMNPPKDSTFSPVVDSSIHDARPTIDHSNITKRVVLRTSTPLAPKIMKFTGVDTPKRATLGDTPKLFVGSLTPKRVPVKNTQMVPTLSRCFSVKKIAPILEDEFLETEVKPINPLEKSILKSSRRKRSLSVADGESFMQKKVAFMSPQIMNIDVIDEKMMASFIGEKENSTVKKATISSGRKRSMSTGTPAKPKEAKSRVKMPNFKAIHELQFQKMESIADHANRRAERAKKLVTPVRDTEEVRPKKLNAASKIPTMNPRKPLENAPSTENLTQSGRRVIKRSLSATAADEPPMKKLQFTASTGPVLFTGPLGNNQRKIATVSGLQRSNSEGTKNHQTTNSAGPSTAPLVPLKKKPTTSTSTQSVAQMNRTKIEERREKNMSLYKSNQVQRTASNVRAKNSNILKGVRLNRRFELQMQHRHDQDLQDHDA